MNWVLIHVFGGPLLSSMKSFCVCQGYLYIMHIHVFRWSMISSHKGVCLWNDVCWVWYISAVISVGLVKMLSCEF